MTTLDDISLVDDSWDIARQLAYKHLLGGSLTWRLIRNGWAGTIDEKEFVKIFNFTRLSPGCIVRAANMPEDEVSTSEQLQHAVQTLGVPLASVVVGIHLACCTSLMFGPSPLWKKVLSEIMTLVEIGYRFGSRVHELGPAAGSLAGFGLGCGTLVVLNENPKHLREWISKNPPRIASISELGAEISQISGFMLQHLGFGPEAAFGAAFGSGAQSKAPLEFSHETLMWISACRWIEALRFSRNYPADVKLRQVFPGIVPPAIGSGARNPSLEALYAEVAPVVREGSQLTWHLPRASYEETEKFLQEQDKAKS